MKIQVDFETDTRTLDYTYTKRMYEHLAIWDRPSSRLLPLGLLEMQSKFWCCLLEKKKKIIFELFIKGEEKRNLLYLYGSDILHYVSKQMWFQCSFSNAPPSHTHTPQSIWVAPEPEGL